MRLTIRCRREDEGRDIGGTVVHHRKQKTQWDEALRDILQPLAKEYRTVLDPKCPEVKS